MNTLQPVVRRAVPEDAEGIAEHLRSIAAEGSVGLDSTAVSAESERRRLRSLDPRQAVAVVIHQDAQLIGLALAVRQPEPMAHTAVVAVSVDRSFRRHHHGRAMLRALEEWAGGSGVRKLCASCMGSNLAARALFTRAGYIQEGVRRQQLAVHDTLIDEVIFGRILPDDVTL